MATVNCSVTKSSWYLMYIEYSYTQNQSGCYSDVTHALKLKQLTNSYDFNGTMNVTYYVNGTAYAYNGNVNIDDKGNTGYTITIKSGSTRIYHDSTTGKAKIKLSCSGSCSSGGWGPGTISLSEVSYDLTTIPRSSVWTEMPHRWYINNDTGGIRNANPTGWNYTQVKYDKKAATSNRIWLKYNGTWGDYIATGNIANPYSLFNSRTAIYNALCGIASNGTYWYDKNIASYALANYYDTRIYLGSYNSSGTDMGHDETDIRVEISMPRVPTGLSVTANRAIDYSYSDGLFNVAWNRAAYCSHYVIYYRVYSQNGSYALYNKEVEVAGYNTTSTQIKIDNLLAGQRVEFWIKGRWKYTVNNQTFSFDSTEWSPSVSIHKQGGMVAKVGSTYKNCHAYVANNQGKPYKADAVYVYTYKDNSTVKEYRLVKMQ